MDQTRTYCTLVINNVVAIVHIFGDDRRMLDVVLVYTGDQEAGIIEDVYQSLVQVGD